VKLSLGKIVQKSEKAVC
jgi:hypothetical protein